MGDVKTKIITVWVSTGIVGSKVKTEFEVDFDATENEIEEAAREVMFELIEWNWRDAS